MTETADCCWLFCLFVCLLVCFFSLFFSFFFFFLFFFFFFFVVVVVVYGLDGDETPVALTNVAVLLKSRQVALGLVPQERVLWPCFLTGGIVVSL